MFQPGEEVSFELVLIGRAQEFFPYFVVAFREINRIGRGRHSVELSRIESLDPATGEARLAYDAADNVVRGCGKSLALGGCDGVPPPDGKVTIEFLTQTRLKHGERYVRVPEFHILFRRLLGRLSSLARFHCGAPLNVDFRGLIEKAEKVRLVRDETRWTRWERYSSRQDRRMEWEGIVGRATYDGDLEPFWPYLFFGQWTHVGKGATFGLGRYRLDREASKTSERGRQ